MLDRAKLSQQLDAIADSLFVDFSSEVSIARLAWEGLCADPHAVFKAHACSSLVLVPSWTESLSTVHPVTLPEPYSVLGVDGSQIYPDRHQGVGCYLINVGTVHIDYRSSKVLFNNQPFVYSGNDERFELSVDLINAKRQDHELLAGHEYIQSIDADSPLFLMDGSLIFWHIASKDVTMRDYFLDKYMKLLQDLYDTQTLYAGYISLPRSKELVNLARLFMCKYDCAKVQDYKDLDHVVDASIARLFLPERTRSIVFKNNSPVTSQYPEHAHPHFFYLNTGDEIARIELPAWIAYDRQKVDYVASVMLDQALKGAGYPVALAEAHEQAVVKGPDREFFYHLIQRLGYTCNKSIITSQKSLKKRSISI